LFTRLAIRRHDVEKRFSKTISATRGTSNGFENVLNVIYPLRQLSIMSDQAMPAASNAGVVHPADEMPQEDQPPSKRRKFDVSIARLVPTVIVLNILERTAAGAYRPTIWTRAEIKRWCRDVVELALISKASLQKLRPWLEKIRRIHELMNVYIKSQQTFEKDTASGLWPYPTEKEGVEWFYPWTREVRTVYAPPILIDIFMSGSSASFAREQTTYGVFDRRHVEEILRLIPEALHCQRGHSRCRTNVTPFKAGAANLNIDVAELRILLQHGADVRPMTRFSDATLVPLEEDLCVRWCDEHDPDRPLFVERANQISDLLKPFQTR
jgi:hypothetical protein